MDPVSVEESIDKLSQPLSKVLWSNTHTTFSPNICHAGLKTNVIPNVADIEVDIRTVPGDNEDEVRRHLDKALGDLMEDVTVEKLFSKNASTSPTGTPLWDVLAKVAAAHYPGAALLPRLIVGFTDAPYFREHGAVAYGFGLFSRTLTNEAMSSRFHGNDERVDVESLALTPRVARHLRADARVESRIFTKRRSHVRQSTSSFARAPSPRDDTVLARRRSPSRSQVPKVHDFQTTADVAKAEAEGEVVYYGHDGEAGIGTLLEHFRKDFPKIKTNYVRLQTGALYAKITAERSAGRFGVDVLQLSDISPAIDFQKKGGWEAYGSPELAADKPEHQSTPVGHYGWAGVTFAGISYNKSK